MVGTPPLLLVLTPVALLRVCGSPGVRYPVLRSYRVQQIEVVSDDVWFVTHTGDVLYWKGMRQKQGRLEFPGKVRTNRFQETQRPLEEFTLLLTTAEAFPSVNC